MLPGGKSLLYLSFDNSRLIGLLSICYNLPQELAEIDGHIGYGVRPSEKKGDVLKYALSIYQKKWMNQILLRCYMNNLSSAATNIKHGGIL